MKRLLVCLDGTWNESGKEETGSDTNVFKLFRNASKFDGASQQSFYGPGVGTKAFEKVSGGVFGFGLFDQIKDGYKFVIDKYQPGDQVVLVGFSRGAYSARCLASFIAECGMLRKAPVATSKAEKGPNVDDLWDLYKGRYDSDAARKALATYVAENCLPRDPKAVAAVAVWDTVGALGVPWEVFDEKALAAAINDKEKKMLQFLNTNLPSEVARGYHAVALDEQRVPFEPSLWDGPRLADGGIEQVWFAGSHSNVGGGFANTGLSDIALDWMIRKLRANHGLQLDNIVLSPEGLWSPPEQTSMDKVFSRFTSDKINLTTPRVVPPNAVIHPSVATRMRGDATHAPIRPIARFAGPYRVAGNV